MIYPVRPSSFATILRGLLILALIVSASGCKPVVKVQPPPPPPPLTSLLLLTPFVGDETQVRTPPPTFIRFVVDQESVAGWLSPIEKTLRFPIDIRQNASLTFRLGARTRVPIRAGDLAFSVTYTPSSGLNAAGESTGPIVVYQANVEQVPQAFSKYLTIDVPFLNCPPGHGELSFSSQGKLGGDPGIDILWGQPAIYYADEMRHKNVLLIGVDTLRFDTLSIYGGRSIVSPDIELMSKKATVFDQARSQASWTLPSFSSIITGRLPSSVDATIYTGHLSDNATTLGEILLPAGYETETICSNAWLGNTQSGFQQGMESLWYQYDASAPDSVNVAKDFITRSTGRDWFLFLHFVDPHVPYAPPEQFAKLLSDPGYSGRYATQFSDIEAWKAGLVTPSQADIHQVRNLYEAEVANVNKAIADLNDFLAKNNLLDNTLIVFCADHGEEFYDHGQFEHGHSQYDELVHMPLFIEGPGFPQGQRIDTSVGNTDIAPTILRYLGLPIPSDMIGVPLQDVVAGKVPADRDIFGEGNTRGPLRKYVVQWPYKCILDYVSGQSSVYNLEIDPKEMNNIASQDPTLTKDLSRKVALAMLPSETAFYVWIMRAYGEGPQRFSGTIKVPGGIKDVQTYRLEGSDKFELNGDTITFDILSSEETLGPNKHIQITPAPGADTMTVEIRVNGKIMPGRFFPYGTEVSEPTCAATVKLDSFPLGPELPMTEVGQPAGCYLWGAVGRQGQGEAAQLDEQTKAQLRALGYVN